jgi:hypothetical protein
MITPANSVLGHGFYHFSPELVLQALTPENGFEDVLVSCDPSTGGRGGELSLIHPCCVDA